MYHFSASSLGFYPSVMFEDYKAAGSLPGDLVEMTDDEVSTFRLSPTPSGKRLGATADGRPCWVDVPPPSHAELVSQAESQKAQLAAEAERSIRPLERAKQLGIATDDELTSLTEWERYSVLLMRVDTSLAPNIEWPQKPQ